MENTIIKKGMYVKYNGGTESYLYSTDPSVLRKNLIYEVIDTESNDFQTNVNLKGVPGKFNSVWFDAVSLPTYFALASTLPEVGERLGDFKRFQDSEWVVCRNSSAILEVSVITNNFYKVITLHTIYIVQIV